MTKKLFTKTGKNSFRLINENWSPEEMRGFKTKSEMGNFSGKFDFRSNSGNDYQVEFQDGKIISVNDRKGETEGIDIGEVNKYWDRGRFELVRAIVASIGSDDPNDPGEEEKMFLYPPSELNEENNDEEDDYVVGKDGAGFDTHSDADNQ